MYRAILVSGVPLLAIGLAAISVLDAPRKLPAAWNGESCRAVAPTLDDGRPLRGIEDMALLPGGETLILSAQDRHRADGGADGLFTVSLGDLAHASHDERVSADPLLGSEGLVAHPHGFALDPGERLLAVISRPGGNSEAGRQGTEIVWGALDPLGSFDPAGRIADPALCRANDLAFLDGTLYASLDRRECGQSMVDLMPEAPTGRVVRITPQGPVEPEAHEPVPGEGQGFVFANGLIAVDGELVVAETRAARLSARSGALDGVALPGGPDNITEGPDGRILAAVHPNLMRVALRLVGVPIAAPSRIVAVDPWDGATEILFDDPQGTLLSGATVAINVGDLLIAGAAFDDGLLVCGGPGGSG